MFSPELCHILKKDYTSIKSFTYMNWEYNDIFALGMWCLYFLEKKITFRTVDYDRLFIDFKALYNEIKTVAVMVNTKFADL